MEDILTYIETLHIVKAYLTFVSNMKCGSAVQNLVNTQGKTMYTDILFLTQFSPVHSNVGLLIKRKTLQKICKLGNFQYGGQLLITWVVAHHPWSHVNMVTQLFVQDFAVLDLNILDTFSMLALK